MQTEFSYRNLLAVQVEGMGKHKYGPEELYCVHHR